MNKHKKSWLIFGIIMVLLVGGITVRYMTVKQSQANAANEEREARELATKYLVTHYKGIKKIEFSILEKPNRSGGGSYGYMVRINGDDEITALIEADNKKDFFANKMSFQGPHYPNGSNKGLDRMEDYNSKRDWKKEKIIQTKKESF